MYYDFHASKSYTTLFTTFTYGSRKSCKTRFTCILASSRGTGVFFACAFGEVSMRSAKLLQLISYLNLCSFIIWAKFCITCLLCSLPFNTFSIICSALPARFDVAGCKIKYLALTQSILMGLRNSHCISIMLTHTLMRELLSYARIDFAVHKN